MKTRVEDAITHSGLFARGDHVLAAVSGGADSVAMLCALEAAAPQLGIAVSVGHFDHRLRAESAREGETLAALCATRGIAYHTGSEDVAARARESGESIEAAARRYRYRFLEATRKRVGATHIATAHTRDDQVETILMRVLRGAGIRGLSGIPQRRGAIVRPLLDVTHTDTLACCAAFGVSYVDDPSNQDRTHTRNLIRHEMLPQLRAWNADVDRNILHMGENAALAVAGVRRLTTPLLDRAVSREASGAWVVDTRALAGLDALACHVFFADLLAERMGCECDAGRVHYERLAELSQPGATSGRMLSLPGVSVRREHESLVFYTGVRHPGTAATPVEEKTLAVPGRTSVGGARIDVALIEGPVAGGVRFSAGDGAESSGEAESGGGRTRRVAYFARESLDLPLVVRSPRRGERMRPFGMTGHKKLSDIFVDRKIPMREREASLVVSDGEEVVWLVGVTTSEKTRVEADSSPIVRITVTT